MIAKGSANSKGFLRFRNNDTKSTNATQNGNLFSFIKELEGPIVADASKNMIKMTYALTMNH